MFYSYDPQMADIHALLAWCALLLFLLRGLSFRFAFLRDIDLQLRVIAFCVYVLLVVTGLSLWVLRHFNPLRDWWLLAKLLALAGYLATAHWAVGRGPFRLLGYLAALLLFAYMMWVSILRSPGLGGL